MKAVAKENIRFEEDPLDLLEDNLRTGGYVKPYESKDEQVVSSNPEIHTLPDRNSFYIHVEEDAFTKGKIDIGERRVGFSIPNEEELSGEISDLPNLEPRRLCSVNSDFQDMSSSDLRNRLNDQIIAEELSSLLESNNNQSVGDVLYENSQSLPLQLEQSSMPELGDCDAELE